MKATDLRGMPVVNIENADRLGEVKDVLVDTESQRLVALELKGSSSASAGTIPVDGIHSIGKDAITVKGDGSRRDVDRDTTSFQSGEVVPLDKVLGSKVLSEGGDMLGTVDEIHFDPSNFHILDYSIGAGGLSKVTGQHKSLEVARGVRYAKGILIVPDENRITDEERKGLPSVGHGDHDRSDVDRDRDLDRDRDVDRDRIERRHDRAA